MFVYRIKAEERLLSDSKNDLVDIFMKRISEVDSVAVELQCETTYLVEARILFICIIQNYSFVHDCFSAKDSITESFMFKASIVTGMCSNETELRRAKLKSI